MLTSVRSNSPSAASSSRAASSRPLDDLRRLGATAGEAAHQFVPGRGGQEHQAGVRHALADLAGPRPDRSPAGRECPAASFSSSGLRGVPYLFPANSAHSSSSPSMTIRSNSGSSTKKYSRPSTSPGRGERVVAETESHSSGWHRRSSATTVLFPTPEGPESTVSRENSRMVRQYPLLSPAAPPGVAESRTKSPDGAIMPPRPATGIRDRSQLSIGGPAQMSSAELVLERRALVCPQTTDTTGLGDAEPFHDLLGANLAYARHGLKQSRDLHLANDVIVGAFLDDVGEGGGSALEAILHLRAFFACSGCLLQGRRTLIRSEGRKSHSRSPRVSSGKTLVAVKLASKRTFRQRESPFMSQ